MKRILTGLVFVVSIAACKNKEKGQDDGETAFFPVLSFIRGQVNHVDTSLYRIVKVETVDSTSTQTYLRREEFRKQAGDFLSLPDIASGDLKEDYKESKMFEEQLNNAILTYTTSKDHEVRREDVMLNPNAATGNSEVKTIIIHWQKSSGDSTVVKNMVWYVDKRFTVVTKVQKGSAPEKIKTLEVIWNDFSDPS